MMRHVVDARGREWEIWEMGAEVVEADMAPYGRAASPWLCFESATQRRWLARYPAYWHALEPRELIALCERASLEAQPSAFDPWRNADR